MGFNQKFNEINGKLELFGFKYIDGRFNILHNQQMYYFRKDDVYIYITEDIIHNTQPNFVVHYVMRKYTDIILERIDKNDRS